MWHELRGTGFQPVEPMKNTARMAVPLTENTPRMGVLLIPILGRVRGGGR